MSSLVVTRGLPASGKTAWARGWAGEHERRARVNRDDMRFMLFGRYWPVPEDEVTVAQRAAVRALLEAGLSVVVDDTCLRAQDMEAWRELAASAGAGLVVNDSFLGVPVEECIRRDRARERTVGAAVIRAMMRRYEEVPA
jgi:predicted kinase